ncbi:MAG: alpha/beta hydrolase [Actinomycetota bacterium]
MGTREPAETIQLTVDGDVSIQAELVTPDDPVAAAVICHPHPLYGGNMYNNVVGSLFTALPAAGVSTLRFNFRGVGGSTGSHGDGVGERADVAAAVEAVAGRHPGLPLLLCGYSFGADVALTVTDDRIGGWLVVAPPLRVVSIADMAAGPDPRPKHLVSGTADDFRPASDLAGATDGWANVQITPIDGANHFFMSGLDQVGAAAAATVEALTGR